MIFISNQKPCSNQKQGGTGLMAGVITWLMMAAVFLSLSSPAAALSPTPTAQTIPYLQKMIVIEALKSRYVSPSLALAVAEVESSFRPQVVSHKGAIGVMQIMPLTSRQVFGVNPNRLYQPDVNIRLGIRFLDDLIAQYDGRVDIALSHYNGGSRVNRTNPPSIIPATRGYVLKVLSRAQHYQTIWPGMVNPDQRVFPVVVPSHQPSPYVITTAPQRHSPVTFDWQNHVTEIDYWLNHKGQKSIAISSHSSSYSYSQQLVKRMHQNRSHLRQWIHRNPYGTQ